MKLVAAKCPSCGANIDVDANSDSTKCEFCNTKIIVEDAIQKLKVEISGKVEVENLPKLDNYLKNGERFYNNSQWQDAYNQYSKALELDSDNYLIILRNGLCSSICSNNYNSIDATIRESLKLIEGNDTDKKDQIASESVNALNIVSDNAIEQYRSQMYGMTETINKFNQLSTITNIYKSLNEISVTPEVKKSVLKGLIEFIDKLVKNKGYIPTIDIRKNNVFVPKNDCRDSYKSLLDLRNASAQTYNSLANENEKIKTKLGPFPWYLKLAIFALIIILLSIIAQLV